VCFAIISVRETLIFIIACGISQLPDLRYLGDSLGMSHTNMFVLQIVMQSILVVYNVRTWPVLFDTVQS
jgi:hypothetical protein